jgi:chitin synthase
LFSSREVPKKLTKAEKEEAEKKTKDMEKEAKKKKNEGGLLGFLMQQASGSKAEKGGMEFSLANLFKCMCFTHEDPEDPQHQLVKVLF